MKEVYGVNGELLRLLTCKLTYRMLQINGIRIGELLVED